MSNEDDIPEYVYADTLVALAVLALFTVLTIASLVNL